MLPDSVLCRLEATWRETRLGTGQMLTVYTGGVGSGASILLGPTVYTGGVSSGASILLGRNA